VGRKGKLAGNIISRRDYQDDTLVMKNDIWIDQNGEQDSITILRGEREVVHSVSRRLGDGRYIRVSRQNPTVVLHFYYKGSRLTRVTVRGNDTTQFEENSYSYDAKGNRVRRVITPRKGDPTNYGQNEISVIDKDIVY
jgi:hypothetical protein